MVFNYGTVPEHTRNDHFDTSMSLFLSSVFFTRFASLSTILLAFTVIDNRRGETNNRLGYTKLKTACNKCDTSEFCNTICITYKTVTRNSLLIRNFYNSGGSVTCAVGRRRVSDAQREAYDVDAT